MPRTVPSIRILPMSDKIEGFRGRSIEEVQEKIFLGKLPANGKWRYRTGGLNSEPGTLVLFQFQARIIASAIFLRDEKFAKPKKEIGGGTLHFEPTSFRTFDPLAVPDMRKIWPGFRAFGHVKQFLNPTLYSKFKKQLRNVRAPEQI